VPARGPDQNAAIAVPTGDATTRAVHAGPDGRLNALAQRTGTKMVTAFIRLGMEKWRRAPIDLIARGGLTVRNVPTVLCAPRGPIVPSTPRGPSGHPGRLGQAEARVEAGQVGPRLERRQERLERLVLVQGQGQGRAGNPALAAKGQATARGARRPVAKSA
jgi:hypothetical protein